MSHRGCNRTISELHFKIRDHQKALTGLETELIAACWESVELVSCTCGDYEDGLHSQHCNKRLKFEERFNRYRWAPS